MNGKPFSSQYAVHPHLRGAYRLRVLARRITPGSSPPMWGIRRCGRSEKTSSRFIPTYVGHTWADLLKFMSRTVHPHIHGAYTRKPLSGPLWVGSSPHTWGILPGAGQPVCRDRFIPTYVGHTLWQGFPRSARPVHPHLRGAYRWERRNLCSSCRFIPTYVGHTPFQIVQVALTGGSSPPTWGILANYKLATLIPAVHPHLRGAYTGPP